MEYELGVIEKLRAYGSAVQASANSDKAAHYYLLVLKPSEKMVLITGFSKDDLTKATEKYLKEEKNISGDGLAQVVLVSAQSIDALRKAYPNYFLDTHEFVRALRRVISQKNYIA